MCRGQVTGVSPVLMALPGQRRACWGAGRHPVIWRAAEPCCLCRAGVGGSSLSVGRSARGPGKNQRAGGFLVFSHPPHPQLSGPARREAVRHGGQPCDQRGWGRPSHTDLALGLRRVPGSTDKPAPGSPREHRRGTDPRKRSEAVRPGPWWRPTCGADGRDAPSRHSLTRPVVHQAQRSCLQRP